MKHRGVKITEKDHGFDRFMAIEKAKHSAVRVGVLGDEGKGTEKHDEKSPMTNAELAAIHEFGTADGHIPERSFVRANFTMHQRVYAARCKTYMQAVFEGKMSCEKALNLIGLEIANDTKKFVTQGAHVPPPNAPSTVERKLGIVKSSILKVDIALAADALDQSAERDVRMPVRQRGKMRFTQSKETKALTRKLQGALDRYEKAVAGVRTLIDTGRVIGAVSWAVKMSSGTPAEQRGF